jgi:hypothetical protein
LVEGWASVPEDGAQPIDVHLGEFGLDECEGLLEVKDVCMRAQVLG